MVALCNVWDDEEDILQRNAVKWEKKARNRSTSLRLCSYLTSGWVCARKKQCGKYAVNERAIFCWKAISLDCMQRALNYNYEVKTRTFQLCVLYSNEQNFGDGMCMRVFQLKFAVLLAHFRAILKILRLNWEVLNSKNSNNNHWICNIKWDSMCPSNLLLQVWQRLWKIYFENLKSVVLQNALILFSSVFFLLLLTCLVIIVN